MRLQRKHSCGKNKMDNGYISSRGGCLNYHEVGKIEQSASALRNDRFFFDAAFIEI